MTSTYVWKNYPLSDKHIYLFTKDDERLLFKNANTSIHVHYIKQLVRTMSLTQVELCVQIKVLLGDIEIKVEQYTT